MGYIVKLQTAQTPAVRTLIDTLNSLLTDVNLNFYPFYIDDNDNLESSDSEFSESDLDSDSGNNDSEDPDKNIEKKVVKVNNGQKKIGGLKIKEVNKTSSILVHCNLDADKFESYEYNYHKSRQLLYKFVYSNLKRILLCEHLHLLSSQ